MSSKIYACVVMVIAMGVTTLITSVGNPIEYPPITINSDGLVSEIEVTAKAPSAMMLDTVYVHAENDKTSAAETTAKFGG